MTNIGKKWTNAEDELLLSELATSTKIDEIAVSHGRTNGAVSSRSRRIAAGFYRDGMSVDEIMKRCRLTKQGLTKTLQNRGLLKNEKALIGKEMPSPSERLAEVNEALKYVLKTGGTPQNKWDYGKMREIHENNLKEVLERLAAHETQISEIVSRCRLRGVAEAEIQKNVHHSFSQQHIQLLEAVIAAKNTLKMLDVGTVEELTRRKIALLEEIASCDHQAPPT